MAARAKPSNSRTDAEPAFANDDGGSLASYKSPAYIGPFQKADFAYWGKLLVWNCYEAGLLTCGFEPNLLLDVDEDEAREAWPEASATVERRWRLIESECLGPGELGPLAPLRVLDWLDSIEEPYPIELREVATRIGAKRVSPLLKEPAGFANTLPAITHSGVRRSDIADVSRPLPSLTKKFHTHQRMLLAMALDQYGYDPSMPRNAAASQIMRATELHGLRVTDDTIRTALREAFEEHGTS